MKPLRSRLDPITDRLRPKAAARGGELTGVVVFAALLGIFPLTYALDRLVDFSLIASSLCAVAIAALMASGALMLIGK